MLIFYKTIDKRDNRAYIYFVIQSYFYKKLICVEIVMDKNQQQEALESIELIKEIITRTQKEMSLAGGGWIAIVWGVFCYLGISGQKLLNLYEGQIGLWWGGLTLLALGATYLIVKASVKKQAQGKGRKVMRWFFLFWLPLLLLAYTLTFFCILLPGISENYITIFILLVVSTGYLMLGFLFVKELIIMGILGMVSTIVTAVFFLEYNDIILSILFGTGLIITGLYINQKWKKLS